MIVADRKPIEEIIEEVKDYEKILIAGCNECVTVCESGGKKEVGVLASALRMYFMNQGRNVEIDEIIQGGIPAGLKGFLLKVLESPVLICRGMGNQMVQGV